MIQTVSARLGLVFTVVGSFAGSGALAQTAPAVTMSASPTTIAPGSQTKVSYASVNTTSCTGSSSPSDPAFSISGTSGSVVLSPKATTTYAVSCKGKKGTASASAQVSVLTPVVGLTTKPTMVNPGQPTTIAYTSGNATSCKGSSSPNDPNFVVNALSGSFVIYPSQTTTYTVTCTNGSTSVSSRAVATVTSDKIVLSESFSNVVANNPAACVPDGQMATPSWLSVFNGYGCNGVIKLWDGNAAMVQPVASVKSTETHAGLISGPILAQPIDTQGNFTLEAALKTQKQLRQGTTPNAWEVGWVLWDYADNTHFYYFIAKPNGWELGKGDPAYPGAQRFLATGSSPQYPVGRRYVVKVTHAFSAANGTTMSVYVDNVFLTTFTDKERPYSGGSIGFYTEDAMVYFPSLVVTTPLLNVAVK
ncbi:hypothetical protein [Methylocystis parvus]|uniref:hypothetical protein n=1 Tax=Methylocystis parvus TaxID=134 RepID=UPI003C716E5B